MEALQPGRPYPPRRWNPRAPRVLLALSGLALPGLAQALRGKLAAVLYAGAAAAAIFGGGLGAALGECPCGVAAGAAAYLAVGVAAAAGTLRCGQRGRTGLARSLALAVLVAAIPLSALGAVRSSVADLFYVPSDSMAPTLRPGDTILVSRIGRDPARGDLVVFRGPAGRLLVKRVAAVGGDRVALRQGELWVNGRPAPLVLAPDARRPLTARYYTESGGRRHWVVFREPWAERSSFPERLVPRGHLFVLGDNRDRSDDSRRLGPVPVNEVVGRAFCLGPAWEDGLRWERAGMLL
jgi:signal peptidase I